MAIHDGLKFTHEEGKLLNIVESLFIHSNFGLCSAVAKKLFFTTSPNLRQMYT